MSDFDPLSSCGVTLPLLGWQNFIIYQIQFCFELDPTSPVAITSFVAPLLCTTNDIYCYYDVRGATGKRADGVSFLCPRTGPMGKSSEI